MQKYLLGSAAALGLLSLSGIATASGVIVNGVHHNGGVVNVPYGQTSGACCEVAELDYTPLPVVQNDLIYLNEAPAPAAPVIYEQPAAVATPVIYQQPATVAAPVMYEQPAVITAPVAPVQPAPRASRGWSSQVYVGARGGWSSPRATDFRLQGGIVENDYDNAGYNVAAVVGWRGQVQNSIGYRLEAELGYQMAEVDSHTVGGNTFSGSQAFGDTNTLYGFANAYLDVPIANRIKGIVGGGAGLGRVEFDSHGVGPVGTVMDDSDTAFGYHLDAGMSYDVTDKLTLEAMYRYTSFVDVELTARDGATSETDVDSHNVLVGARYGF